MGDRYATCRRCKNRCPRGKARGICSTCHETLRTSGRLDEFPVLRPDTQGRVRPLLAQGMAPAQIARELGITRNAAFCAVRAIRRKEGTHDVNGIERLYVSPPPAEPECTGRPDLFVDWLTTPGVMRNGHPTEWAQLYVREALRICARCPVQQWCVDVATVPHRSGVTIIAGGKLWVKGRVVWDVARQEAWEAAQDYEAAS